MNRVKYRSLIHLLVAFSLLLFSAPAGADGVSVQYLFNLSDFNGFIPYNRGEAYVDNQFKEAYVINGSRVDVFNRSGMQIYDFFLDYGAIYDLTVEPGGDIIVLTRIAGRSALVRCNYRGEPRAEIALNAIPPELASVYYTVMRDRNGLLYLIAPDALKVLVTDHDGAFVKGYDLEPLLAGVLTGKEMQEAAPGGFDVDEEGNILFTLPVKGQAYKMTAGGDFSFIGRRGSGPGKFGVPSAIAADRMGNIYVCDKLRCVVLVFDKSLKFVTEFGFRGLAPGNLIVPVSIAIGDDKAFVGQLLNRGVNVYKLSYN